MAGRSPLVGIRLLGPLQVERAGQIAPPGGSRQRTVLATLALDAGRVVSADALAEALWGAEAFQRNRRTLHVHVHNLRALLGPRGHEILVTRDPGYLLDPTLAEIDTVEWAKCVDAARGAHDRGEHELAAAHYGRALNLWRGPLLVDLDGPLVEARRRQWDEEHLIVQEQAIDAELAAGRHATILGRVRSLASEHPLRERFWAQLMLALYRSGRQADALEAFQEARSHLVEELGVDPGPALRRLEESILRQTAGLELEESSPAVHWLDPGGRPSRQPLVPSDEPVVIGRSPECDIVLSFDSLVSRRHARLAWSGRTWTVEDLGSSNGTFLNGRAVEGPATLDDGAVVRCGETILVIVTVRAPRNAEERRAHFVQSTLRPGGG